jgi:hypothetical protein
MAMTSSPETYQNVQGSMLLTSTLLQSTLHWPGPRTRQQRRDYVGLG